MSEYWYWFKDTVAKQTLCQHGHTHDWNGEVGAQLFADNASILAAPLMVTHWPELAVGIGNPNVSFPAMSSSPQNNFWRTV